MIHRATLDDLRALRHGPRARREWEARACRFGVGCGGIGIPGSGEVAGTAFNGNFASLFTGVIQSVQTDLGLTYGGTMLATTGNTSATVLTLSGALATAPVPILVKATNSAAVGSGATFSIYYDGGTVAAMTLVTPTGGVPVPLTGAATGLSLTWTTAASVTNDTWNATCAGLADQSGNGWHYSRALASAQPLITVGLNGHAGIAGGTAGQARNMLSVLALPRTTTPVMCFVVVRALAWSVNARLLGETAAASPNHCGILQISGASPRIDQYDGLAGNFDTSLAINSWGVIEARWGNSVADYLRLGSAAAVTGASCGDAGIVGTGREIFSTNGANFGNYELLALVYAPPQSTVAARAAVASFYAGLVAA